MALALSWTDPLVKALRGVTDEEILRAAKVVRDADLVLTAGNGGSAAIASHAAQAISKPSYAAGGGRAAVCLTDMVPLLTAHANDGGWETALVECAYPFLDLTDGIKRFANLNIVLLVISSSGKSKNIVNLARLWRDFDLPIIALTGFAGGPLRDLATVPLHVESDDYEVIEPAHDAILHRMQYHLRETVQKTPGV